MYEYAVAYRALQKSKSIMIFPTIPLPIESADLIPSNIIRSKIVIFHGLNTSMKGSEFIIEALETIKSKYPDKVEVILDGKMPLNEYLELISRTNIVVDQCYGYSYGMNALYSMAMGKVVLSGNEPECEIEFGVKNIPIVNILPNAKDIEEKIEHLINNQSLIDDYSKRSIEFVNNFHNITVVAQQYIDIFNER
jgi:glycosyltransferase involved in cell wall biosynthesis